METIPKGSWHYELITSKLVQAEMIDHVIHDGTTAYQHVRIHEGACFGRTLVLDDKTQSTETDEFVYHEALVHPSMIGHTNPMEVFVAGGGEGATIREVLKHEGVKKVVMVDIDKEVVELCKKYLPNHHQGAFDDPRLELIHKGAFEYLSTTNNLFDVAIIDVPDPLEVGPAYTLFTKEFYMLLLEKLNPQGIIAIQSGPTGPNFSSQCFSAVVNTISTIFPFVLPYEAFVPSFGSTWGFVVASNKQQIKFGESAQLDVLIKNRISGELKFYDGITHKGMFATPKYLRNTIQSENRVITLENPLYVE